MLSLRLLSEAAALVAAAEPALCLRPSSRPSASHSSSLLLARGLSGLPQPRAALARARWFSSSSPSLNDAPSTSTFAPPPLPPPPPPTSRSPVDKPRPKKFLTKNKPSPPPPAPQLFPSLSTQDSASTSSPVSPVSPASPPTTSTWNQIKPGNIQQKIAVSRETRIQSLMDDVKKLSSGETPKEVSAAQLERLDKECQQLLSFFRPRNIASYLFRRTRISGPPPPLDLLISLEKRGLQIASDFEAPSIVMVLQGLSRLPNFATSEEYLRALERQSTTCMQEFGSQDIALCLDALSRFYVSQYHLPAAEYFPLIEQQSLSQMQHFNSKDVAHSLSAIARFGKTFRPSNEYLSAIERRAIATIRSFSGSDIVYSLSAARSFKPGTFSANFFTHVERQLLDQLGQLDAHHLRLALTAFDRLGVSLAEDSLRAAKQQFVAVGLPHASAQDIYDLLRIFHAYGASLSPDQLTLVNDRIRAIEADIAKSTESRIAGLARLEEETEEIVAELEAFENEEDLGEESAPEP